MMFWDFLMMKWHLNDGPLHLLEVTLQLEDETFHPLEIMFHFGSLSHAFSPILREANFKKKYILTKYP